MVIILPIFVIFNWYFCVFVFFLLKKPKFLRVHFYKRTKRFIFAHEVRKSSKSINMNRYIGFCGFLISLASFLSGCTDGEEDNSLFAGEPLNVDLAYSVSSAHDLRSRLTNGTVQADGSYRGIRDVHIIPFATKGQISSTDRPLLFALDEVGTLYDKRTDEYKSVFYYYDNYTLLPGTASFLFYANASPIMKSGTTDIDKVRNGSLVETFPHDLAPSGIGFRPETIVEDNTIPFGAQGVADYLTYIAQTPGWADTRDPGLRTYFLNFTGQSSAETMLIAGSTVNAKQHVNKLYEKISGLTYGSGTAEATIAAEILSRISTYSGVVFNNSTHSVTSLGSVEYPANVGLPDGAAALRWSPTVSSGYAFVPQTETTTVASINNLTRFAYPADLRYFVNSRIKTSNIDKRTEYYSSSATWADLLDNYEYDNATVNRNTLSAAIKEPVQYAVACLQVSLLPVSANYLEDAEGEQVPVTAGAFPLTGVIVGGQHNVDFSFKPKEPVTDVDMRFVYDSDVQVNNGNYFSIPVSTGSGGVEVGPVRTLVLQNYNQEEVTVVLEFRNDTSQPFMSMTGIVYPGTKFYLVATLTPETVPEGDSDYKKRVFTQDYTTTARMRVSSFAKAYNILPDLLTARLEVGVEIVQDWIQADPITVELN